MRIFARAHDDDSMKEFTYTIVLDPAEEGRFNVAVPALPGRDTRGDSYDEAPEMAKDAIKLRLDTSTAPS